MRLLAEETLPPYSYVPGLFPHPVRDPAGHAMEVEAHDAQLDDPRDWEQCRAYLRGLDLLNHGYYWEAHECWEAIWHYAGRKGMLADFLKALIKLAAALVKAREGRAEGVRRHARRASELLLLSRARIDGDEFMGLSLQQLVSITESIATEAENYVNARPDPVVRLLKRPLIPSSSHPGRSSDA